MYTNISIIYNPNSTGNSESYAKGLQRQLQKSLPDVAIRLIATKYAGHAEELSQEIANSHVEPLIVSSSGDGGYNEVVNGVMKSGNDKAICAVLPAGNANDHSRTVQGDSNLAELIIDQSIQHIDVLKVHIGSGNEAKLRYAHSYVGLGLTPVVAVELNRHDLNALKELWLSIRAFYRYRPFRIRVEGKIRRLDSLLFANINQMAKILTLSKKNRPDDGKMEVVMLSAGHKLRLVHHLLQATMSSVDNAKRYRSYEFTTLKPLPMQLDGEIEQVPTNTLVRILCIRHALKTIR